MRLMMAEWDIFAQNNLEKLPTFTDRNDPMSYALFQECMHLLDLSRMIDTHYEYNPRVLAITIL
jgi:hypothetical protein